MVHSRRKVLLWASLTATTGCDPDWGPISDYNDAWEGTITFDGQAPRPLRADLLVTRAEGRRSLAHDREKIGFAELSIGGERFAARARMNHLPIHLNFVAGRAVPDREFVLLELVATVPPVEGVPDASGRAKDYAARFAALLDSIGLAALPRFAGPFDDDYVGLWGERTGGVVEGIAFVRFPDARADAREARRGTFRLARTGLTSASHTSDDEIETAAFRFQSRERREEGGTSYSWEIQVR